MTPMNYLTACRIQAAQHMLIHRLELSITSIAFLCGFSSSQYFATVFAEHAGCPPREFRLQHANTVTEGNNGIIVA